MQENVKQVIVKMTARRCFRTEPIWQYDGGHVLTFEGFDLPMSFEVHFSRSPMGNAIPQIGTNGVCTVPEMFTQNAGVIYAWLYIADVDSRLTKYSIEIPVAKRAKPTNQEPTPVEQSAIDQAIAALNAGVEAAEDAQEAAEAAQASAESYAESAGQSAITSTNAATAAATSAGNAASSATAAASSATDANASRQAADLSATNAGVSERNAAASATAAAGSATSAAASAGQASGSATAASGSASTASTKAGEAAQSATAAAGSAASASENAGTASTAATAAGESATAAAGSATAAAGSATSAGQSATAAAGSAAAAQEVLESIPEDYSDLSDDVNSLKSAINETGVATFTTKQNYYIRHATGIEYSAKDFVCTDYIDLADATEITYTRLYVTTTSTPSHGVAFYDSNKVFIEGSGVASGNKAETRHYEPYQISVPAGARYARFTLHSALDGFYVWLHRGIVKSLYDTVADVDGIKSSVNTIKADVDIINAEIYGVNISSGVSTKSGVYIRHATGEEYASSDFLATDYISLEGVSKIRYTRLYVTTTSTPNHGMAFYDANKDYIAGLASGKKAETRHYEPYNIDVPSNAAYARFTLHSALDGFYVLNDGDSLTRRIDALESPSNPDNNAMLDDIADALEGIANKSNGKLNCVARARMLTDVAWTPIRPVPNQLNIDGNITYGQFNAGEKVVGAPYAAQLRFELWLGKSISMETFISALKNPNSVIYDFSRAAGQYYRSSAWYSVNCSKFASFCIGLKENYSSGSLKSDPNVDIIKEAGQYTADDIEIGDIIEAPGIHTAFITDKIYNEFGDISQIEVSEAITPSCRRKRWNTYGAIDNYFEHFAAYRLERYRLLDSVPPVDYRALYPYVSETLGLNYGNKSNYIIGDVVKLTIFKKVADTIAIIKNGSATTNVDVSANTDGDEITLSISDAGMYTVNFVGGNQADGVEFCMNDPSVSYDAGTSVLTFACNTATLDMIGYRTSGVRSWIDDVFPAAEDIERGTIVLTDVGDRTKYFHVFFKNIYGIISVEIDAT